MIGDAPPEQGRARPRRNRQPRSLQRHYLRLDITGSQQAPDRKRYFMQPLDIRLVFFGNNHLVISYSVDTSESLIFVIDKANDL